MLTIRRGNIIASAQNYGRIHASTQECHSSYTEDPATCSQEEIQGP